MFTGSTNRNIIESFFQTSWELDKTSAWFKANQLLLNEVKTKYMISDCNWSRTQNHFVRKRTLGQFGQMIECSFTN